MEIIRDSSGRAEGVGDTRGIRFTIAFLKIWRVSVPPWPSFIRSFIPVPMQIHRLATQHPIALCKISAYVRYIPAIIYIINICLPIKRTIFTWNTSFGTILTLIDRNVDNISSNDQILIQNQTNWPIFNVKNRNLATFFVEPYTFDEFWP